MPTLEQTLTDKQKQNLEIARRRLSLRSRADVFRWFADKVLDILDGLDDELTPFGMIERGKPPAVPQE